MCPGGVPALPSSWPPWEPEGWELASGGGALRVWMSLLVWGRPGVQDKEDWELPELLRGRGLGSKELKGHLQPPHPHRFPDGGRPETFSWGPGATDRWEGICEPPNRMQNGTCARACAHTGVIGRGRSNTLIRFLEEAVIQRLRTPAGGADSLGDM